MDILVLQMKARDVEANLFESLPREILVFVDSFLSFEDSINFMLSNVYVEACVCSNLFNYDHIQVCDEPSECILEDRSGRVPPRHFHESSLPLILRLPSHIRHVTVLVKEVTLPNENVDMNSLKGLNPYVPLGYLGRFFSLAPPSFCERLLTFCLHVDVMIESLRHMCFPCPTQDLVFALNQLSHAPFETFVQISFCCAQFDEADARSRSVLMAGMEHALKYAAERGCETEFVVEPAEGYVDMTVERKNLEYSFAFFYYNPSICDPVEKPKTKPKESVPSSPTRDTVAA